MLAPYDHDEILWDRYQSLPADVRLFTDILILIFEPVSLYQFEDLLRNMKLKTDRPYFNIYVVMQKTGITKRDDFNYFSVDEGVAVRAFPTLIKDKDKQTIIGKIQTIFSGNNFVYNLKPVSPLRFLRHFLYGYFTDNNGTMMEAQAQLSAENPILQKMLVIMLFDDQYHHFFGKLPVNFSILTIGLAFEDSIVRLRQPDKLIRFINRVYQNPSRSSKTDNYIHGFLGAIFLFKGELKEASQIALENPSSYSDYVRSICLMYMGDMENAKSIFSNQVILFGKALNKRKYFPELHFGAFYLILLMIYRNGEHKSELEQLEKIFFKAEGDNEKLLLIYVYIALGRKFEAKDLIEKRYDASEVYTDYLYLTFYLIAVYLLNGSLTQDQKVLARELQNYAVKGTYFIIAKELQWIIEGDGNKLTKNTILEDSPLLSRYLKNEGWEELLKSLLAISGNGNGGKKDKEAAENRLVYLVDFDHENIQPVLQTRNASGWNKGRSIALKKLKSADLECLTPQDIRIAATISQSHSRYNHNFYIDFEKTLPELVGHPLLFYYANPEIPVEIIKSPPELITEKTAEGYRIRCDITETNRKFVLRKETNTRYRFIELTKEQLAIIRTLSLGTYIIPKDEKDKLSQVLSHVSSFIPIQSDLVFTGENIRSVEADSRIRIQLLPVGDSLKAEFFVKPFGNVPPYYKPGKGGRTVYGMIDNEKLIAVRNLDKENENAIRLANTLSAVSDDDFMEGPVMFDDPYRCLTLLEVLRLNQDSLVVEWPEGERFKIRQSVSFKQLQLKVNSRGNWFELSGELKVDEDLVLTLQQLMALRSKSKGRFIEVGENEFLALSADLKKRLDELSAFSAIDKNEIRINKFATHTLEEIAQNAASFQTDMAWNEFHQKIQLSDDLKLEVPSTLQAELRPYQEEGFRWMARLASWNAGACLADDMGLGKTIQALTLLLHRAPLGPGLVICPASVVNNWINECNKFAPNLNIKTLSVSNREEVLGSLKSFDLLVTTYGILQSAEELITKIVWETVILDEAHAVKNYNTKTSKAAMNLVANFKLVLTGTPVQNHLGEIWNLFNFINPGLLGTFQQFNERFLSSREVGQPEEKLYLKKLISPFILRRTKSAVLDELPTKTEITHKVELTENEMAFYEALRRQAIATIESDEGAAGQKHLKALAEITRLRLACCNVALVDGSQKLRSAKLDSFFEIVDELLENNHRALVFSQFIGHLNIVRNELNNRRINYQYLDGSTPIQERGAIVRKFQEGNGDLFLISLKAGGLGLNLTGADYVIHLDPWWNPAIEDQASDRAHRIGQTRPVTIYRLVAKDTIEEKIIQLHHSKRDMADSLLEGTDQAAKLSTNDLLNLLKQM